MGKTKGGGGSKNKKISSGKKRMRNCARARRLLERKIARWETYQKDQKQASKCRKNWNTDKMLAECIRLSDVEKLGPKNP